MAGVTTAAIVGGAALAGGVASGIGASKAADAQESAAKSAAGVQKYMFDESTRLSEPWREGGENALQALQYELGLGELPMHLGGETRFGVGGDEFDTHEEAERHRRTLGEGAPSIEEIQSGGFQYAGFQETPGYQFNLDEGQKAINRSLAARGGLLSGNAVKEGMRFSQGLADQTYSNHLARLANVAGAGGNVAQQQGATAIQTGQGIADARIQQGNARASGYAATGQAISGGFNQLAGMYGAGMFSDRRLKDDIRRIGETAEGYPKYEFRYVWEEPGTVRVGVIADEVDPDIVTEVGGYMVVDYSKVTL